jgi:hypothetical protein
LRRQIYVFWLKKNLTEINHKVSVLAKGSAADIAVHSPRNAQICRRVASRTGREARMQGIMDGAWGSARQQSVDCRESLRELNHRFLCLGTTSIELCNALAALADTQRGAVADCPYALFDLRFHDDAHWQSRLHNRGAWRIADAPPGDAQRAEFTRLALFLAWHLVSTARHSAQLILGMNERTAGLFAQMTVNALAELAPTESIHLAVRWRHCEKYWCDLGAAAARADQMALKRAQLFGIQLAAAEQLPLRR